MLSIIVYIPIQSNHPWGSGYSSPTTRVRVVDYIRFAHTRQAPGMNMLFSIHSLLGISELITSHFQLAIELATHGTMGNRLCIVLVARNMDTHLPKLFIFDPQTLKCQTVYSSFSSKNSVTSMSISLKIQHQVLHKHIYCLRDRIAPH